MKTVLINKKKYNVCDNEFNLIETTAKYNTLKIIENVGLYERLSSLIYKLSQIHNLLNNICFIQPTHGGFMLFELYKLYNDNIENRKIYDKISNGKISHEDVLNNKKLHFNIINVDKEQYDNINYNIQNHNIENIEYYSNIDEIQLNNNILFSDNSDFIDLEYIQKYKPILITKLDLNFVKYYSNVYQLTNTDFFVYIPDNYYDSFINSFHYYVDSINNKLSYDNLIHLCIMVKNAGPQFETMLYDNMNIIDRWTILDTGSTDDTINIINRVLVGKKEGQLYQEPFINFRDSRNRCFDLAGKQCKFILTLDDTYVVKNNLRDFLNNVRGDQVSDSFSIFIESDDTDYGSNRIIKSESNLRYKFKIHEVINDFNNINIIIPKEDAFIEDRRFDYMEKRTMDRKQLDLKLLYEEVEEDPTNPRHYYYLAQTYNIIGDYENAYKYFLKRAEFSNSGFIQERIDALFEAARCANFKLNKPWSECLELYEKAFKADESRPESLYFIGIHYHLEGNNTKAYDYFTRAFKIGFPIHCQYSLKPTLCFHFLPKFLVPLCYENEDYILGEEVSLYFLKNNKVGSEYYDVMLSWYSIFKKLNLCPSKSINNYINIPSVNDKPYFIFIADGGFFPWSGKNIVTTGVGGSETYIIEHARNIQKSNKFNVIVFCNTPNEEDDIFEEVQYKHITFFYNFIMDNYIHTCIVSRFSEYLPCCYYGNIENVYLVVHDLTPSGIVIPIHKKLKNIFCLTEWHVEYMRNIFHELKDLLVPFYYGIDFTNFKNDKIEKKRNKFIYSSFPNRGLLELLEMWPLIWGRHNDASLYLFCDVNNKWSNDVEPDKMNKIKSILQSYGINCNKKNEIGEMNIYYKGWVSKKELADEWLSSDIWFYPCTFMETFCLTALEAAITKTLVITNDLAALQNTVGERGVIIKGDATSELWKKEALDKILEYMDTNNILAQKSKSELININYKWAENMSWSNRTNELLDNYIMKNIYEYKGMYNWTNDLPKGSKEVFEEIICYFNKNYKKCIQNEKIQILEIGTYTGISLIEIVKRIPNSYGTGVDMWTPYKENNLLENMKNLQIEESFHKNIKISNMEERINGIKCDSKDLLLDMIKKNDKYDFIYIDGSHLCIDCYIDLVLSWELLEVGGIIAIDDYLYKKDDKNILNSPYEGINHFLNKYEGTYILLHKSYRVFLQKI